MEGYSLQSIGIQIRTRRKNLGVKSTMAAQSAGLSRVTLHRIEKGEPSVSMGAYWRLMQSLGMDAMHHILPAHKSAQTDVHSGWIPARVRLADYPALKSLAWHVHGLDTLRPAEALAIYERNARHLDEATLDESERQLLSALREGLG